MTEELRKLIDKEAEEYADRVYGLEGSLCTNIQEQACMIGIRHGAYWMLNYIQSVGLASQSDMDKTIRQNIELKKEPEK